MEEFKPYFETYEVSNLGNIRKKLHSNEYKIIGGSITNRGYKYFQLTRNNKRINFLVHHAVAQLFIGERPDGLVIDHIDRNKLNNNVLNLRYITQKENSYNRDGIIQELPIDLENRKQAYSKYYSDLNREELIQKKRQYYELNKDKIKEKEKLKRENTKVSYICEICNETITVQKQTLSVKKTKTCNRCSSIQNLKKINVNSKEDNNS